MGMAAVGKKCDGNRRPVGSRWLLKTSYFSCISAHNDHDDCIAWLMGFECSRGSARSLAAPSFSPCNLPASWERTFSF